MTTDIGVVVADAWQGRGVGSALMRGPLARAQTRGVSSVTMDVLHDNRQVLAVITSHWPAARMGHCSDYRTIRIPLPRPAYPSPPGAVPADVRIPRASAAA